MCCTLNPARTFFVQNKGELEVQRERNNNSLCRFIIDKPIIFIYLFQ